MEMDHSSRVGAGSLALPAGGESLLFDLELQAKPAGHTVPALPWPALDLSNDGLFAHQVLQAARRALAQQQQEAQQQQQPADLQGLALSLQRELPHARFVVRSSAPKRPANPASDPSWALRSLRHQLIVATTAAGEELLIEASFRSHFALPGACAAYAQGLVTLPDLVVLTPAALRRAVAVLAARLAAETAMTGRDLPPWRQAPALLSKFLPAAFTDTIPAAPAPAASTAAVAVVPREEAASAGLAASSMDSSNVTSPTGLSPNSVLLPPATTQRGFKVAAAGVELTSSVVASLRAAGRMPPAPFAAARAEENVEVKAKAAAGAAPIAAAPRLVVVGFAVPKVKAAAATAPPAVLAAGSLAETSALLPPAPRFAAPERAVSGGLSAVKSAIAAAATAPAGSAAAGHASAAAAGTPVLAPRAYPLPPARLYEVPAPRVQGGVSKAAGAGALNTKLHRALADWVSMLPTMHTVRPTGAAVVVT